MSIWTQGFPSEIGSNYRMLAGLQERIPPVNEAEKTPPGYYDYKNLPDRKIIDLAKKASDEYQKIRKGGKKVRGSDSFHSFDYVIGALEKLVPKLSDAERMKLAGNVWTQHFKHTGYNHRKLPEAIRKALYWAKLHVRPKGIKPSFPYVQEAKAARSLEILIEAGKNAMGSSLTEAKPGEIIIKQLGGAGKLKAMIGARNFLLLPKGVAFRWPAKQRSKGNYVEITLRPDDTYDVEFSTLGKLGKKQVRKTYSNVYADALGKVFTSQTGLRLRL